MINLMQGDCLERMKELDDNSVDSIVTDPPYGLSFMGKHWDKGVPSAEIWAEALRVLKPGGHLLAFAGTRTQHRMAVNIEDAGFEIRDMIAWVYGSGFPKSLDVSKAIDKAAGAEREVVGREPKKAFGYEDRPWKHGEDADINIITAPATEAAKQWDGWGTALKPALEPITVARKPFKGTVAANVLENNTGAINIDGCRVGTTEKITNHSRGKESAVSKGKYGDSKEQRTHQTSGQAIGRWPANLIHDGSDEVLAQFPDAKGQQGAITGGEPSSKTTNTFGAFAGRAPSQPRTESTTSAARFFYCAKASNKDRGEGNNHPTVKPSDLMRYLCRLVTPPNGIVVDPFMGSGSTGKAAVLEGFSFVGIELEPESFDIASKRIDEAHAILIDAGIVEVKP